MKGLLIMFSLATLAILIAWEIQKYDLLLGHTFGVLGALASVVIGIDILTKEMK